jgi:hypothetical protein
MINMANYQMLTALIIGKVLNILFGGRVLYLSGGYLQERLLWNIPSEL